jgi:hypothetical protein
MGAAQRFVGALAVTPAPAHPARQRPSPVHCHRMIPEVRACSTPAPYHPALPHQPDIPRERRGPASGLAKGGGVPCRHCSFAHVRRAGDAGVGSQSPTSGSDALAAAGLPCQVGARSGPKGWPLGPAGAPPRFGSGPAISGSALMAPGPHARTVVAEEPATKEGDGNVCILRSRRQPLRGSLVAAGRARTHCRARGSDGGTAANRWARGPGRGHTILSSAAGEHGGDCPADRDSAMLSRRADA